MVILPTMIKTDMMAVVFAFWLVDARDVRDFYGAQGSL
jgi:hypothetical protein